MREPLKGASSTDPLPDGLGNRSLLPPGVARPTRTGSRNRPCMTPRGENIPAVNDDGDGGPREVRTTHENAFLTGLLVWRAVNSLGKS